MKRFTQNGHKYGDLFDQQKGAFASLCYLQKILLLTNFIICVLQSIFNNISVHSTHVFDLPSLIVFNVIL